MALVIATENDFGFPSDAVYVKIDRFSGNKESIELDVLLYANADSRATNKRPYTRRKILIQYPIVSVRDIMEYCYNQLKLQFEFYNAKDI